MPSDFHAVHYGDEPLLLPNAWDFASAAALAAMGFDAVGTTSLGVAAAAGLPDATGLARDATLALARVLAVLPVHLSVDIESGFSETPEEVAEVAAQLAELGIAGVNIEDGRADGTLADPGRHAEVIEAVKRRCPDLFLNARTDPYWLGLDRPLERTLERARRYREAGADGIFVPGAVAAADISTLADRVDGPLNILFSPAHLPLADLAGLGVARVSTGSLLFRASQGAVARTAAAVRDGASVPADLPAYGEVQDLIEGYCPAVIGAARSGRPPLR
ncbi:isocitrate lyase/phosphoenolpyruvate mutase family protein [Glycomyces luteolus]|uniref:Isocitrate lyase/phosphoenolpyruvate mutase family protein n=1 Tax=Glycomyces luteolus TaxID=2670330 RepID=A0A9X3P8Q3_9ACTN|nr:isocitrate lyase/phosphoenolpyruvate mutase family protein [Glycomyces luteolus]MDA1359072.1 isocitrate lyase/phosphoenolpyruvate mutase family protein [Glycomyces luteolus]